MKFLEKTTDAITRLTTAISAGGLVITTICLFLQVVFRVMHFTATWTSEIARYAFMVTVFYGMAAATDRGLHLIITLLSDKLKPNVRNIYSIFTKCLFAVFLCVITYGILVTANRSSGNNQSFEAFTNIKISNLYYIIFVGLAISTANTILSILKDIVCTVQAHGQST